MITVNIGKARLRIHAEGCIDCGTMFAPCWYEASTINVTAHNRKPFVVLIHRCGDCQKKLRGKK